MVQFSSYYVAYAAFINIMYAPLLKTFINANDAVLLFFLHSGYVLALPFISGRQNTFPAFVAKRVFRIYPAHVVIMCLLLLGIVFWHPQPIPGMGDWFNRKATVQPHLHDVIDQNLLVFMDPDTGPTPYNGVVWSLVHEMRISLLFPVLVFLLLRRKPGFQLAFLIGYPVGFHLLAPHSTRLDHLLPGTLATIGYIHLFLIGIFLAEHREYIASHWSRLSSWWRSGIMLLTLLGYSAHMLVFPKSPLFPADPILTVSLSLLVIAAANNERVFLFRPVRWLGKISYSLYLVHIPLLVLWTRLFYPQLPFWAIWLLTIASALGASAVLYAYVEAPLQQYGRVLAARIDSSFRDRLREPA